MRRPVAAVVLAGAALPLLLGSAAQAASDPQGRYLAPFREDGAHYDAATNTFTGGRRAGVATDANGCVTGPAQTGAPAGNPRAWDCLPAGASLVDLPTGKVLFWNALEGEEQITGANSLLTDGGRLTVNDESRVLTLRGGAPAYATPGAQDGGARQTTHPDDLPLGPLSAQHYPYNNGDMFCSDQVLLSDGTVLTAGGTDYYTEPNVPVVDKGVVELEGVRNTRFFDPRQQAWHQGPSMTYGRWYPSLVTLADGQVFAASGVSKLLKPVYPTRPLESGTNVKETETLTVGSAAPKWVVGPASASKSLPLYPRLHLLPDGHVYYDAAGQDFNPFGQSIDEATWEAASSYDPRTKTWTDLGVPGADPSYLLANPTAVPFVGFRGSTFSAALTMRPSAVVAGVPTYTSASFLTAGGVLGVSPGSYVSVANSRITTVDTAGGAEKLSTVGTGDLRTPRWFGTATPLPNGQVFLSSGANVDEVAGPGTESPIRTDELFTPQVDGTGRYTGGTWAPAGSQARKRTYHNNALLLPDGSVLIGGHAPIATGYFQTIDTPDLPLRDGTNNHHDASFQVWQPPYFNDPARPRIGEVEAEGRTLVVSTPDAARIASVVLMRNTAQTHLVDGDARTVALPVLSRTAGAVTVGLPATTAVLPNGPYLLFANASKSGDLSGRDAAALLPSRGVQLFVGGTTTPHVLVPDALSGQSARKAAPRPTTRPRTKPRHAVAAVAPAAVLPARPAGVTAPSVTAPGLDLAADRRRGLPWSTLLLATLLPALAGSALLRLRRRTG
jgi:hypothetical protein